MGESVYGKIPDGMQIHHIDYDKTNNAIENLQCVSPLEHNRLHSGCRLEDGLSPVRFAANLRKWIGIIGTTRKEILTVEYVNPAIFKNLCG